MKGHEDNTKALYAVLLAAVLGGAMPVFVKMGVNVIPPLTYSFLRFFLASIFIIPILFIRKIKINSKLFKLILISLLPAINIVLFSFGIRITSATMAQTLAAGMPLLVLVFSHYLLNERITKRKLLAIGIGFLGLLLIIFSPVLQTETIFRGGLAGNILVFIGVILSALYAIFSKKIQDKHSPMEISIIFVLTTFVVTSLAIPLESSKIPLWISHLSPPVIFGLIYVASIGGIVYYLLHQKAIKHGSPLIASMLLYLQPVFTYFWALILLGERLTLGFIIGTVLTFTGAGIITLKHKR